MLSVLLVGDGTNALWNTDWESLGCTLVDQASDGVQGLAAVERCNPDLILTEIPMPRMNGLQMLSRLRESGCGSQVILLAPQENFHWAQTALWLGAADYLQTPVSPKDLADAIDRIHRRLAQRTLPAEAAPIKSKYVLQAMAYIAQHYADDDISITTIADNLRLSEGHLSHMFKKETGSTVIAYLTQYRIRKAMELLRDCRKKIYEVAEQVGYRDVTYFSTTFKRVTGVSPSEYQAKNGAPSDSREIPQVL